MMEYINIEDKKPNNPSEDSQRIDPNHAFDRLTDLCSQFIDLQKSSMSLKATLETNATERERIKATKEVTLARIQATKEALMTYLNKSFDQREKVFQNNFKAIDAAIESGNMQALAICVQSVNILAASSPFKDLLDTSKVQQQLLNGGEVDI